MTEMPQGWRQPRIRLTASYGAYTERAHGVPETLDVELDLEHVSAGDIVAIAAGLGQIAAQGVAHRFPEQAPATQTIPAMSGYGG